MAIVVGHEVSGKTYGTAALQVGAAKAAKEAREREEQRQFQREQMQMQADLQARASQQNFQQNLALKELSNKQDLVQAAELKDIELQAKAKELEQSVALRKELMGQVDPYGSIKISEALATQEPQYDYSSNPQLQKKVNTINKGMQTLNSYLSSGLFDNRMDEYKMIQANLQNQLDIVNSQAKPIKSLAQEFNETTFAMTNPLDGTTQIVQRKKNGEFGTIFKASKTGTLEQTSFDLLSIADKEKIVNSVVKTNPILATASNAEKINAGREYFNALSGGGATPQTSLETLPPEKIEIAKQIQSVIGPLDPVDIEVVKQKTPQELQEFLQKKIQAQIALNIKK